MAGPRWAAAARGWCAVATAVALLPSLASAHLEFFCASSVFSNHSQYCNKAIIWLGTYAHEAIPSGQPAPGKAVVYKGANPVKEEPFTFEKYCATSTSTTGHWDTLPQPPTQSELEAFIKGLTADDCLPDMGDVLAGISPDMKLTCYTTDMNTPVEPLETARCPSARFNDQNGTKPILGALIPIVLDGVTSTDDISIIVHSAGYEVKQWLAGPRDACSVASVDQIDESNTTCYMNILNWDGSTCGEGISNTIQASVFPQVEIGGCGVGCGPYTPLSAVDNNDCTAALVESGTTCNIVCPAGMTAVGSPVSCQAGAYIGDITCTNGLAAWIEDVRDNSTAVIPDANLDQIQTVTGPGCGEWTAVGTTCYITCAYGFFSTGTVSVVNIDGIATWVPSPDAQCVPTTCGTGTAIPDEGVVEPAVGGGETQVSGHTFMNDGTMEINQPGCNFDPGNDRIILIPREMGSLGLCGSVDPVGAVVFDCDRPASNDLLLQCVPDASGPSLSYNQLPLHGQICVCDADFEKGCDTPSQFSKLGGVTDATSAPTHAPTTSPTFAPSHLPTTSPTFAPTNQPTKVPTFAPTNQPTPNPTNTPTRSPTFAPSHLPTTSPTFSPSHLPTFAPSNQPTLSPTHQPTFSPTPSPTFAPSRSPTFAPSNSPTRSPTNQPSFSPTRSPTNQPSFSPTRTPTHQPSFAPTAAPFVPAVAEQPSEGTLHHHSAGKGKSKGGSYWHTHDYDDRDHDHDDDPLGRVGDDHVHTGKKKKSAKHLLDGDGGAARQGEDGGDVTAKAAKGGTVVDPSAEPRYGGGGGGYGTGKKGKKGSHAHGKKGKKGTGYLRATDGFGSSSSSFSSSSSSSHGGALTAAALAVVGVAALAVVAVRRRINTRRSSEWIPLEDDLVDETARLL